MDPQQDFKSRYDKYIAGRNQTVSGSSSTPPKKRTFSPNKFYFLGIFVGILLILPVTYLYLSNQVKQSDTTQVASTPSAITDAQIDTELKQIWGPYYAQVKDNPTYIAQAKKNIQIRTAAKKEGIGTSSIASSDSKNYAAAQNQLQNTVEEEVVNSRTINFVSVFKNPLSPDYARNKTLAVNSLEKIQSLIEQGETMEDAYNQAKRTPGFDQSVRYFSNEVVTKDSGWNKQFKDAIFALQPGQTTPIVISPGGSFMMGTVTAANNSPYNSLNAWLDAQQ